MNLNGGVLLGLIYFYLTSPFHKISSKVISCEAFTNLSIQSFINLNTATFSVPKCFKQKQQTTVLFSIGNKNPNDYETEEQREARMSLVRQIQKSYYRNSTSVSPPALGKTRMLNVPLWRVPWTELPGYQNVLNVHEGHYTDMFQRVLAGSDETPRYFGHVFLPGGSENLGNPEYELKEGTKSSLIGTLMQITDSRMESDGRLTVVVQALERFQVVDVDREKPYSVATVEILPDVEQVDYHLQRASDFLQILDFSLSEDISGAALAACITECFKYHGYEYRKVMLKESTGGISPLSNYDSEVLCNVDRKGVENSMEIAMERYLCDPPSGESPSVQKVPVSNSNEIERIVEKWEYKVWVELDQMLAFLRRANPNPYKKLSVPVPAQMMGLLPQDPYKPWPEEFMLDSYTEKLEGGLIGTSTKSPFVRVSSMRQITKGDSVLESDKDHPGGLFYPPLRRAHRLSYVVFMLLESIVVTASSIEAAPAGNLRQQLLEIPSLSGRLEEAYNRLKEISNVLSVILEERGL